MTPHRYEELMSDPTVINTGQDHRIFILSPSEKLLIDLYCIPVETFVELYGEVKSRIILTVYPGMKDIGSGPLQYAKKSKLLVMFDCAERENAFTYQLTIDEEAGIVTMTLHDPPKNRNLFITESDIAGISKKKWEPYKKLT